MVLKLIIFKLTKLSLYKNRLLLKLKKHNHFGKKEEDPTSIPFILILLISLYFCRRIASINSLRRPIKKKL